MFQFLIIKKGASKEHKINFVAQFKPISASNFHLSFKSINFHLSNPIIRKFINEKTYIHKMIKIKSLLIEVKDQMLKNCFKIHNQLKMNS